MNGITKAGLFAIFAGSLLLSGCNLFGKDGTKGEVENSGIKVTQNSDGSYIVTNEGTTKITIPASLRNKNMFIGRVNISNEIAKNDEVGKITITNKNRSIITESISISPSESISIPSTEIVNIPYVQNNDYLPKKNILNSRAAQITRSNEVVFGNDFNIGQSYDFITMNKNNSRNSVEAKGAVLKYKGNHCNVWYKAKDGITLQKDNNDSTADTKLHNLQIKFDAMFEIINAIFGENYYTTNYSNIIISSQNPKVNIVVYDIYDDVTTTKETNQGTFGYFAGYNFFDVPDSNKCQIIFIDSYFLEIAEKTIYSTLAHEYQHLLNYVNKTLTYHLDYETWYTEMLSMLCEDLLQKTYLNYEDSASPKSRLSLFNTTSTDGFKNWQNSADKVLNSYANAYAFGAYLLRNYGDFTLLYNLARNEYANEDSITAALSESGFPDETYDSVLKNYCKILSNNSDANITLNISPQDLVDGTTVYKLTAIDLWGNSNKVLTSKLNSPTLGLDYLYFMPTKNSKNSQYYYGPIIYNNYYYPTKMSPTGIHCSFYGKDIMEIEITKSKKVDFIIYFQD